ncbi:hypothetical protein [Mycobacterium sp. SM1]|uniref:hypothetical protein n=1 Tax=Mycobacterium sp. SM1 TaxID=2816243 RepID=UPI001F1896AE|nr:hypothetical protein [Mycobacterium sp. SM1]
MDIASEKILVEGLDDSVDLSQVHWHVARENPSAPLSEVQKKTLETIRSLVEGGLFTLGSMSGEGGRFVAWDTPLDESIKEIHDVYVNQFDDRPQWVWYCWLDLTDKGRQIAQSFYDKYKDTLLD